MGNTRAVADLYFAYGSNLHAARLRERVPSARALGAHLLEGFRFALDKPSRDGSAKANLRAQPGGRVWGAVYSIDAADWARLDACEPGYRRLRVRLRAGDAERDAEAYLSQLRCEEPVAYHWYKQLIVDGAREHALPSEWIEFLQALPARPDPTRS